jgi:histone H2A
VGFPHLPGLIRLDLVFNDIPGGDLVYLSGSRHLQTIMMGANKIDKLDDLQPLSKMRQLFQLDLINNPIQREPGYRVQVFQMIPSLTVLDTLDKSGKDAYNTTSMVQTASRVPTGLFDTSRPAPSIFTSPPMPAPVSASLPTLKSTSMKRSTSKKSVTAPPVVAPVAPIASRSKVSKGGKAKITAPSRSLAGRAGIVFPVARIKRHMKGLMIDGRISRTSAVYMAAVLEYLTAELTELAGNVCKTEKKMRITPRMIKHAIDGDEELKKLLNNITIPREE